MSIPVPVTELATALAPYPWGYLMTVRDDLRAQCLAVPTDLRDGVLHAEGGRSTNANLAARPEVTMVFPHPSPGEYTLIVDGTALVTPAGMVELRPTAAILHRPAVAAPPAG